MKKFIPIALAAAALVLAVGCAAEKKAESDSDFKGIYTEITQEEAKEMMKKDDGHLIVDVRRQDEYDEGHIPDAVCIPNESIGTEQPEKLPDKEQILLIYCRSGRRSKQAAQKLADIGYTNIYEFGGIIDWTGEIVTD
ncbi:MAG: rhodanese-like domain-containing protein [Ruminococcus sp.]|nr:rhodanese-like domain-containing protein [Ruminococcus sp.]MBR2305283.1 rhodanese-like domain-containing protein [Ruminococcus sp.]